MPDDRLTALEAELHDELLPQLRTVTATVNALVASQKPGLWTRFLATPAVWITVLGILTGVASFTIRNVNQLNANTTRIEAVESIIPASRRNSERVASSLDNLCRGLADIQRVNRLVPMSCVRTEIEPLEPTVHHADP